MAPFHTKVLTSGQTLNLRFIDINRVNLSNPVYSRFPTSNVQPRLWTIRFDTLDALHCMTNVVSIPMETLIQPWVQRGRGGCYQGWVQRGRGGCYQAFGVFPGF